jgi:hypothetical protein
VSLVTYCFEEVRESGRSLRLVVSDMAGMNRPVWKGLVYQQIEQREVQGGRKKERFRMGRVGDGVDILKPRQMCIPALCGNSQAL